MSLSIRLEVEKVVGDLWEEVKTMSLKDLHKEVADRVLDPGTMVGRAFIYDCLLMLYCVNICLVGHSSIAREAKFEGDVEPVKAWKEHNSECHLMHKKIDVIAAKLNIPFYSAGRGAEEFAHPREKGSHRCSALCGRQGAAGTKVTSYVRVSDAGSRMDSDPQGPA